MKAPAPLKIVIYVFFLSLCYFHGMSAQAVTLSAHHKSPIAPAFEKNYIDPINLVYMPDGLYYFSEDGTRVKVIGTVLTDSYGTYVLQVEYQCPLCGRVYLNKEPDEDHGCPLFMYKVHPKIWAK